ncbi:gamma carbonic anhydrase family protein [Streptomyces gobiensis]|uniref:gamma carbonic anhydrase family protein n=1 Tax=Streptomyces gobiensis TaxID=2875706 RepID=UPI001E393C4A|nr:gamma carbonic anhydrase family protein [Streptomyces gobiensis]UGY91168.1 gamma carbonic anhydrase family protein [Streptomyces gobiensis]
MERPTTDGIYPLIDSVSGNTPDIHSTAFVAPTAVILGAARLGARSSVWYHAVLRADYDMIEVGEESNVQDGVVLHADPGYPVRIGARVSIGHNSTVHGCHVEDDVLIGMGTVLLNGSRIGRGCIVAAGTVVPENRRIAPSSVVAGPRAALVRPVQQEDLAAIQVVARANLAMSRLHRSRAEPPHQREGSP